MTPGSLPCVRPPTSLASGTLSPTPSAPLRLVKQALLSYRQGTSDKVYEVDLCAVDADQFVVNFRYGRRGSALREGTKTSAPVTRSAAEDLFTKLVQSKLDKGYSHGSAMPSDGAPARSETTPEPPTRSTKPAQETPETRAILHRLRETQPPYRTSWDIDRLIWRAGVLGVADAEPELIRLLDAPNKNRQLRRYCVAWALGRFERASSAPALQRIFDDLENGHATRAIAAEALRRVLPGPARGEFLGRVRAELPESLRELAQTGPATDFTSACLAHLVDEDPTILYLAYILDDDHTRPAVLAACTSAEFRRHTYRLFRTLFKAAAYRADPEVFATLARRFEKEWSKGWDDWQRDGGHPFFRAKTRNYLRRLSWRVLQRLGAAGDPNYVPMATAMLLRIRDSDAAKPRRRGTDFWGPFAPFLALNHILYGRSERFYQDRRARFFRARHPEPAPPTTREESFPELWNQAPQALLDLLEQSHCLPVHEFAVLALRDQHGFVQGLNTDAIVTLLNRPYQVTAELGFELATQQYRADAPDLRLVAAVALCEYPPARAQGMQWLETHRTLVARDSELLADLLTSQFADTRAFTATLVRASTLESQTGQALVGRLIASLLTMGTPDLAIATDLGSLLGRDLAAHLAEVADPLVLELLSHELAPVQQLAADIARIRADAGHRPSNEVLVALLGATHREARAVGVRLLEQLADSELAARPELLYSLARHPNLDLRESIRPVIARVAAARPEFARAMADLCLGGLRFKADEGVHEALLQLLREDLHTTLEQIPKADVLGLLQAQFPHAQELGGHLLAERIQPEDLSVREIVRLASHEILAVRRTAWSMSERSLDRLLRAMHTTTGLLDAKWADSRQFAMRLFREELPADALTPEVLVAICDSVRPDVQSFGRGLITERFEDPDGPTYLLKLSEHPSESLQLFATNYLTRFAADDPRRLAELEPYFVSVLSRVHKARVAKNRCLAFLGQEGLKSQLAAEVAARILTRQSVTMAIQNKATMIETMLRLRNAYPNLDLPITTVAPTHRGEARGAV